ncbi:MAG: TolC family protein [Xanthomonadales bacterium]|nr:TolC family protein [Xanthomonadales bacterium]
MKRMFLHAPLLASVALLQACASLPRDRGAAEVDDIVARHVGASPGSRFLSSAADESGPEHRGAEPAPTTAMTEADLVAYALKHHPDFVRLYAELGVASVARFDAGRLANPGIGYRDLDVEEAGALNVLTWSVHVPLAEWLLSPARARIGRDHWQAAVHRVAAPVGERVLDVRAARIRVAEAERALKIAEAEADVADAARALARRMYEAGTIAFKQLAAERAAAADAALETVEARATRDAARLALAAAIGWPDVASMPAIDTRLDLPGGDDAARDALVERALREHPDIIAARHEEQAMLRAARIAKRAWWLLDLDGEYERERGDSGVIERGPGFSLSLPLFRQGQDTRLAARALEERAQADRAERELQLRYEIDAALAERRAARERIALLREEVLPAHENLVREHQREYDYMLAGAFELIEARRDQYRAYRDYLAAVAEHLLAGIDLSRAVGTDLGAAVGDALPDPDLPGAAPASDAVDHSSHTHGDTP